MDAREVNEAKITYEGPLRCGCDGRGEDTVQTAPGVNRCKHGRIIFTPFLAQIRINNGDIPQWEPQQKASAA